MNFRCCLSKLLIQWCLAQRVHSRVMNSLYKASFAIANAITYRCLNREKIALRPVNQLFGVYKMAAGSRKMATRSVFASSLSEGRARKWLPAIGETSLNGEHSS